MDRFGKIAMIQVLVDENIDSNIAGAFLDRAGEAILNRLYPYGDPSESGVPARYDMLQCEIATYLYSKLGAEGQTAHSENGVVRKWDAQEIPQSYLAEIVPFAKGVK